MGTKFYLRGLASTLTSAPSGSIYLGLSDRCGSSSTNLITTTTAGGTSIDVTTGANKAYWFSEPVTTAVTLSGTMTVRVRGLESAATVNAGFGIVVERTDNSGSVISTILNDTVPNPAAELNTTVADITDTYTPTSTSLSVGDRIKVTVQVRNVGTMDVGTVTFNINSQNDASAPSVMFDEDVVTDQQSEFRAYEIYGSNAYR